MTLYILTQLITMGISLKIKHDTYNKTYKDIGDNGYVIDSEKLEQLLNEQPKYTRKEELKDVILFLIPGINIANTVIRKNKCVKQLKKSIKENDALKPMSDIEYRFYQKLPNTLSKASYVVYSDAQAKQIENKMKEIKIFFDDEEKVLENNIAQLYYDRLPAIAYSLEEVKKLSSSIDLHYKLGKMCGINTAIIGLPNDNCEIKKTIVKKDESLVKYEYEQKDEEEMKNEKFIIYPFGTDFNENDKLKECYDEIIESRDNIKKGFNNRVTSYNIYTTEDKPIVRVKRK